MHKMKLDVSRLQVESFQAGDQPPPRGTVHARMSQVNDGCVYPTAVYHSCAITRTCGEQTCYCLYPDTDMHMCCSDEGCTGNGGMC